jgi:hypothetical protein
MLSLFQKLLDIKVNLNFLSLVLMLFATTCLRSQELDTLSYFEKLNSGDYYPNINLSHSDVKLPLEVQVGIDILELREVDIKSPDFYSRISAHLYYDVDSSVIDDYGDTISLYDFYIGGFDWVELLYPEHDKLFLGRIVYDKVFSEEKQDSLVQYSFYMENQFPHKWDLRDYPFDQQRLRFIFDAQQDTSVVHLIAATHMHSNIAKGSTLFLKDGLVVTGIETESQYKEGDVEEFVEGRRREVNQRFIINILVDRKGSFLYFKLFFGGFLSFLISYLAFYIDSSFFETRITLSIGGIFGAVGNKYVVENTMPAIQVLTKADIINNLVIVFIILNIFIVIGQQTKSLPLGPFERNKFAGRFIMIAFVILNLFIAYF